MRVHPIDGRRAQIADLLRQRILAGVHTGLLNGGDRLPSVRDVAAQMHTGGRVALAAYRELAAQGLVRVQTRSGIFVRETPTGLPESLPEAVAWMVEAMLVGLDRGVTPAELRRQLRDCLDGPRVRLLCLECNHDQIHALCRQIQDDYGFEAVGVEVSALAAGRLPKRAAETDLILSTRFHAVEAERLGRELRRPVLVATLDPVFVSTVRGMLAQGRVFWICTDPRFVDKLPQILPGCAVHPLVLGRDSLDVIPTEARVYATVRASEALPPGWRRGRVVTVRRSFSSQTARSLLAFGLGQNLKALRTTQKPALPPGPVSGIRSRRRS